MFVIETDLFKVREKQARLMDVFKRPNEQVPSAPAKTVNPAEELRQVKQRIGQLTTQMNIAKLQRNNALVQQLQQQINQLRLQQEELLNQTY